MIPSGFICPNCSARLRFRDRPRPGFPISCPDCDQALEVFEVRGQPELRVAHHSPVAVDRVVVPLGQTARFRYALWLSTAAAGILILWLVNRPGGKEETSLTQQNVTEKPQQGIPRSDEAPQANSERPNPLAIPVPETEADDKAPVAVPGRPVVSDLPLAEISNQPDRSNAVENSQAVPPAPTISPILPEHAEGTGVPATPDADVQLALNVSKFQQAKPTEVRILLQQIAEASALGLDLSAVESEPWKERVETKITLQIEGATLREILDAIVAKAGLQVQPREGVLFIVPPQTGVTEGNAIDKG